MHVQAWVRVRVGVMVNGWPHGKKGNAPSVSFGGLLISDWGRAVEVRLFDFGAVSGWIRDDCLILRIHAGSIEAGQSGCLHGVGLHQDNVG